MRTFICRLTVLTPDLVMVKLTLTTYTHTLIQVLFTCEKIFATWFGRRGHLFSRGCIASTIVWGSCPLTPESLCGYIPVSHTIMSLWLAGCTIHLIKGSRFCGRTRGSRFTPLQPWQHFSKMQPTVLVSLPVFHGSLVSQRLHLLQE